MFKGDTNDEPSVTVPAHCDDTEHEVVCDDLGLPHPNVCILLARKRQLSYIGHCIRNCKHNSAVCAVSGETYMSECAALADSMLVDYHLPCHTAPYGTGMSHNDLILCLSVLH